MLDNWSVQPELECAQMDCPYQRLPATSWWGKAVSNRDRDEISPHLDAPFKISREDWVASGGSCFAQHISQALQERGYRYFVSEPAPDFLSPEAAMRFNYNIFSARYGNIYTTLQLLQLVQRAFGILVPRDQFWSNAEGRVFDLLRPRITPNGFASLEEAIADEKQHLTAVRSVFTKADVFVFTLGLTESWISAQDGVAYPTCPGCGSAGKFDPEKYQFKNLSVVETAEYLNEAIGLMKRENPALRVILTVSPVPLAATMEPRHVLQASTYSKSVLRVAAENVVRQHDCVHYFASYEIIAATRNSNEYFESDGRTISAKGVARAMQAFFDHFAAEPGSLAAPDVDRRIAGGAQSGIVCDEEDFFRSLAKTVS
jgi:GSCFA family protein